MKKVGKRPWEVFDELHTKHNFSQSQVDLLIRAESIERFYDYTERLGLGGQMAYRLLIELRRRKRREGILLSDQNIDRLAEGISRKIMMPEQVDSVIDILAERPSLNIDEAVKLLGVSCVGEAELGKIVLQKLRLFDEAKIRSDANYRKRVKPKIAGEVLKAVNHSVSGRRVVEKIDAIINGR